MNRSAMNVDAGVFFGLWLRRPLHIAAVTPSTRPVADAMARLADLARRGPVLELGAGTGSLTDGLIRAGCMPDRIIAIEREAALAALLRRRFPAARVIEGDATWIDALLRDHGVDRLCAVVSSLPIKWFPPAAQRAILYPCLERLDRHGRFLQLTNAVVSPIAVDPATVAARRAALVWRNLPPVQIWSYTLRAEAM
jgi:phosphatidylethanolamine/phosphatidyl-N-methylethanolamine N-methyltransferase